MRIDYLTKRWSYFLGFGTPFVLVCSIASSTMAGVALYALVFPHFIIMAIGSNPRPHTLKIFPTKLDFMFWGPRFFTDRFIIALRTRIFAAEFQPDFGSASTSSISSTAVLVEPLSTKNQPFSFFSTFYSFFLPSHFFYHTN